MDYLHLVGAEHVATAARQIAEAAQQIKFAASSIEFALERHERFLDQWLDRFQQIMENKAKGS